MSYFNGYILIHFLLSRYLNHTEAEILDPGYYKWIHSMGATTHEGLGQVSRGMDGLQLVVGGRYRDFVRA